MSLMTTINLNGVEIPDDETHCGLPHRWPDDIAGYIVVLTKHGHGKVRDVGYYDSPSYWESVGLAREIRELAAAGDVDGDYARIDVLYNDGCRGIL